MGPCMEASLGLPKPASRPRTPFRDNDPPANYSKFTLWVRQYWGSVAPLLFAILMYHREAIAAIDFFAVPTVTLRVL